MCSSPCQCSLSQDQFLQYFPFVFPTILEASVFCLSSLARRRSCVVKDPHLRLAIGLLSSSASLPLRVLKGCCRGAASVITAPTTPGSISIFNFQNAVRGAAFVFILLCHCPHLRRSFFFLAGAHCRWPHHYRSACLHQRWRVRNLSTRSHFLINSHSNAHSFEVSPPPHDYS